MSGIDFDKIKPGALKRQLKVSQDYTFKLKDLDKMAKTPNGKNVMFEGRNIKMTPLLKRRVNFARNAKRFASKNKGKNKAKNPVSEDQLDLALQRLYPGNQLFSVETMGNPRAINDATRIRDDYNNNVNLNERAFVNPNGRLIVVKQVSGPRVDLRSNEVAQNILNEVANIANNL